VNRGSVFAHSYGTEPYMDRTLTFAVAGAAITAVVLVLAFGPVVAAFIVASTSFVLMFAVMMVTGFHHFERWRHSHHLTLHRTKTH